MQERAFPASARPDHRNELVPLDRERNMIERMHRALARFVITANVLQRNHAGVRSSTHRPPTAQATPPKFRIVAETEDYLVVDKPPFLLIHPSKPDGTPTLWAALRELLAFELVNGGQVSIVNRLDRETSGLVLVAKNYDRGAALRSRDGAAPDREGISRHRARLAGVGNDDSSMRRSRGRAHIGPSAIWLKQAIHEKGAPAVTEFRVENRFVRAAGREDPFSVIRAIPRTGRTHQIRVHLAHLGHPLVGDKIYGPNEELYLRFIETGWTEELAAPASSAAARAPFRAACGSRASSTGKARCPTDLRSWTKGTPS